MAQREGSLLRFGFSAGNTVSCLSPVLGLAVFWWVPFKPAVPVYVIITGLAYALFQWIELARLSLDLDEIVTKAISHKSK